MLPRTPCPPLPAGELEMQGGGATHRTTTTSVSPSPHHGEGAGERCTTPIAERLEH